MNKEFGALHQKELGEDIKYGGSPDMGSGLYSQKLSYKYCFAYLGIGIVLTLFNVIILITLSL